ncbi:MAG: tetratricopeptide repeat protein [Deltaproteobacteria bacterium]|nr:tetratricopeptide repeat protein [Deltaproteobacteria bacterium]
MTPATADKDRIAKTALRYIQKGQFQKAIEEYRKALSSDPRDIRLRLKVVDLYGRLGRKKEAVEECLQVADSYSDQGFYLKAIAVYKQAVRFDPENPALWEGMGDLYIKQDLFGDALGCYKRCAHFLRQQGQNEAAERLLFRMAEMAPESTSVRIPLAELYLEEGKTAAFETELDRLVRDLRTRDRLPALLQLLESFRRGAEGHPAIQGHLAEISAGLRAVAEADRARSEVSAPAAGRDGFGRPVESVENLASWSTRAQGGGPREEGEGPRDLQSGLLEVDLCLKYGLEEEALESLRGLALSVPDSISVHERLRDLCARRQDLAGWTREQVLIGELHVQQKECREALRAFEEVLKVDPDHAEAREAVRLLRSEGVSGPAAGLSELGAGVVAAEPGQREAPGPASTGLLLPGQPAGGELSPAASAPAKGAAGLEGFELSELDDIVREFKSGIADKIDTSDYDTHYNLGMAYKEMGLLDDALEEFRIAARSPERSREAYTCMALVYRETERFADARAALRMALAGTANTPEDQVAILFELGVLAEDERDWDGAFQAFTKASTIDPAYRDLPQRLQDVRAQRGQ